MTTMTEIEIEHMMRVDDEEILFEHMLIWIDEHAALKHDIANITRCIDHCATRLLQLERQRTGMGVLTAK